MDISYCDGDAIEARILELLQAAPELGSDVAIAASEYHSWPVRYHLCPERANLVRHLDWSGQHVLELGAGMGGVSRYLAEHAASLTVVEGTQARYDCLSARLRDLDNWSGTVGNLQDVQFERKFDVVCVFGVLEYAELFLTAGPGESAFDRFLAVARRHLTADGVLVLAIENRLGLKYWSGAAEDHTDLLFNGISGYPASRSPKTFSRQELRALCGRASLPQVDEFYPFPDYKIPTSVVSAELVTRSPELAAEIAGVRPFENCGAPRVHLFPDLLGLHSVARAGLLPEFANSFLMVCSGSTASPVRSQLLGRTLSQRELGWHYALARKLPTRTTFVAAEAGTGGESGVEARKAPLGSDTSSTLRLSGPGLSVTWKAPPAEPILAGEALRTTLVCHAYYRDWTQFEASFEAFLCWSAARWVVQGESQRLRGDCADAILTNAVVSRPASERSLAEPFRLFDHEWTVRGTVATSWFVFRNVCALAPLAPLFDRSAPFRSLHDLYDQLCQTLGVESDFTTDVDREATFQELVGAGQATVIAASLLEALDARFGERTMPGTMAGEHHLRNGFWSLLEGKSEAEASLQAEIEQARGYMQQLEADYEARGTRLEQVEAELLELQSLAATETSQRQQVEQLYETLADEYRSGLDELRHEHAAATKQRLQLQRAARASEALAERRLREVESLRALQSEREHLARFRRPENIALGRDVPLAYFVIYGPLHVDHIRNVLMPALEHQSVQHPRQLFLMNYLDNSPCFSGDSTVGSLRVSDLSATRKPGRIGYGDGLNQLFEVVAPTPLFFVLNPDTAPAPDFSGRLLTAFDSERDGIVEARQWPAEHPKEYNPTTGETPWASGACLLIGSDAFRRIGGFDTTFFLYCEDVDLSWRMWLADRRVVYVPEALCEHYTGLHSYAPDRFYPEHYYSAVGFLLLGWKYFGTDGEARALRLLHDAGFPSAFEDQVLERYRSSKSKVARWPRPPHHPMVKVLGYNLYHRLRQS